MAAVALVGAGISAYSAYQAGEDKKQAYELEAQSRRAQSAQVEIGAQRDIDLTQQHADMVKGAQISAVGSSGTTLSGTNLRMLEQTAKNAFDQINSIKQASDFRKNTLLVDAGQSDYLGGEASRAGTLSAAGSLVSAYGGYTKAKGGYS